MIALWGQLSLPEFFMLFANVVGFALAIAVTGESQMDLEAVRILGRRGLIAGADERQWSLKARGKRRDEGIKIFIHLTLLSVGIIIAASPTPHQEYEEFTALWLTGAVTIVAIGLAIGSYFNLLDRRRLWAMFQTEDETEQAMTAETLPAPLVDDEPTIYEHKGHAHDAG